MMLMDGVLPESTYSGKSQFRAHEIEVLLISKKIDWITIYNIVIRHRYF